MILPNATFEEIYKGMTAEHEKVAYALRKNFPSMRKAFQREPGTAYRHTFYEAPVSRNKYILYYALVNKSGEDCITFNSALMLTRERGHQYYYGLYNFGINENRNDKENYQCAVFEYTGHFFSRYRERMRIPDKTPTYDLVARCLSLGYLIIPLEASDIVGKLDEYRDPVAWQVREGIILGEKEPFITADGKTVTGVRCKTFITEAMLKGSQVGKSMPGYLNFVENVKNAMDLKKRQPDHILESIKRYEMQNAVGDSMSRRYMETVSGIQGDISEWLRRSDRINSDSHIQKL